MLQLYSAWGRLPVSKLQTKRVHEGRIWTVPKYHLLQIAALNIAMAATLVPSAGPVTDAVAQELGVSSFVLDTTNEVLSVDPVTVGLFIGVDAINSEWLHVSSSAPDDRLSQTPARELESRLWTRVSGADTRAGTTGRGTGAAGELPGRIQLIHPVSSHRITSSYGWRKNPTGPGTQIHIGQDYGIPCGSPVFASAQGTVIQSAWAGHSGKRVTIDHGNSVRTGYSHNSKLIANVGDVVEQGQIIARSGTTGNSTGCHVHFEVIVNGRWHDPRNYLPGINGQPHPLVDSRQTTIAAGPIRNSGGKDTRRTPGYDVDINLTDERETSNPDHKQVVALPAPAPRKKPSPEPPVEVVPKPLPKPSPEPPTVDPNRPQTPAPMPTEIGPNMDDSRAPTRGTDPESGECVQEIVPSEVSSEEPVEDAALQNPEEPTERTTPTFDPDDSDTESHPMTNPCRGDVDREVKVEKLLNLVPLRKIEE